jgi:hypothetical protein
MVLIKDTNTIDDEFVLPGVNRGEEVCAFRKFLIYYVTLFFC